MPTFEGKGLNLPTQMKKNSLIFREIEKRTVTKSYMTNELLIYGKYLRISSYIRKPYLIYDLNFATDPI